MKALAVLLAVLLLAGCAPTSTMNSQQSQLGCAGDGDQTVILMAGQGDSHTTWDHFRTTLGSDIRTCTWDYPGIDQPTVEAPMTAAIASDSLEATLKAANVTTPVILVGHSIAGLTIAVFAAEHPNQVGGVVLFDPTVPSFARRLDLESFHPGWDGATSARQVNAITSWPDIPLVVLRHDSNVYLQQQTWDEEVEEQWVLGEQAYADLSPRGTLASVSGAGHYVYVDQPEAATAAVLTVLAAAR